LQPPHPALRCGVQPHPPLKQRTPTYPATYPSGTSLRRSIPALCNMEGQEDVTRRRDRSQTTAVADYNLTFSPREASRCCGRSPSRSLRHRSKRPTRRRFATHRPSSSSTPCLPERRQACTAGEGARTLRRCLQPPRQPRRGSRLHPTWPSHKVQTLDGRWLSIDGRILFKAALAAPGTVNTAVETTYPTVSVSNSPSA
jgi:hypothetical protein